MTVKQITERTAIPISLVVIVIGVAIWGVRLEGKVTAQEQNITSYERMFEKILDAQLQIDRRLARIEGKLGVNR